MNLMNEIVARIAMVKVKSNHEKTVEVMMQRIKCLRQKEILGVTLIEWLSSYQNWPLFSHCDIFCLKCNNDIDYIFIFSRLSKTLNSFS